MKIPFQYLTLSMQAATALALAVMCGCTTVTMYRYNTCPVYARAPMPLALRTAPLRPPPRPVRIVPRQQASSVRIEVQRQQVQHQEPTLNNQASGHQAPGRPEPASYDHGGYDRIVVPREYAQTTAGTLTDEDLTRLIVFYENIYGVDRFLTAALIRAESNFDPYAVSPKGARGLMQLMSETATSLGVADCFDPAQNIAGGTLYLATQLRAFNGDLSLALAGYNAGPEAVRKYGGIPPYRETQDFVQRVTFYYRRYAGK